MGVLSLGTDHTGKRDRRTVYAKTKPEVVVKLRELRNKPKASEPGKQLLRDYLAFWLKAIQIAGCKPKTHECYEKWAIKHIIPHLGGIPVAELSAFHAHHLFETLAAKGATAYTQRYAHRVLRSALTYAVEPLRLLPSNPLFGIKAPKHITKKFTTWTIEQCGSFLTSPHVQAHRYYVAFVLSIDLGMREGEVLGLWWEDVDLATGVLHVRKTLNCIKGRITGRGEPKTAASKRTIPLTPRCIGALRQQRARLMGRGHAASPWVVSTERLGGPVNPSNYLRTYKVAVAEAELPYIRPHDMRHSNATIMVQNGVNIKDVADRLGHSSVTTTLNTYVHSDLEQQRKVTARFAEIMGGKDAS